MRRGPEEGVAYELVPTYPAVSRMSGSGLGDEHSGEGIYGCRSQNAKSTSKELRTLVSGKV